MSDITFSNRYSQIFSPSNSRPTISQINIDGNTYDVCDMSSKNMLDEFYDSTNGKIILDGRNNEPNYNTELKEPIILINSNFAIGSQESPSLTSDIEAIMILAKDREGADRSWISHVSRVDGLQGIKMETKRGDVENWFELLVDADGRQVVELSNPAAWRSALGFGTDIYLNTAQASEIITPESNVTIDGAWYAQRCNMAMLRINFHFKTNLSNIPVHGNHGDIFIGRIAEGKRPLVNVHPHSNGNGNGPAWFHLASDGALSLCATEGRGSVYQLNSGTPFYLFVSYIVA